jgi:hypothetical protein
MELAARFVQPVVSLIAAVIAAWLVAFAIQRAVRRKQARSESPVWRSLQLRCRLPFRITLATVAVLIALPYAGLGGVLTEIGRHVLVLVLIAAVTWLVIALTRVAEDVALSRLNVDVRDNRRPRRIRTQIVVFRRVIIAILVFVAIAAAVMTIPPARTLQIAITDPVRIDDVVVVNDEWGRVDEITLTYVVVRTWDNRRLILPISWFTTNVFQNWTRHEARVLGSILLHVEFTVPVEELRAEMYRVVQRSPLWDGQDWVLQVVDTTPSTMVVRGLVSSADAPSNWDLRCDVREKLLAFLQERHPEALPKVRADVSDANGRFRPTAADSRAGSAWRDRSTAD